MSKLPSIGEVYNEALKKLTDQNREIDIRLIINKVNKYKDMNSFYIYRNDPILSLDEFNKYFEDYLSGKPVEYVLNEAYFDGDIFYVDENVLIPRVETEEVVHNVVKLAEEFFKNDRKSVIYDICTGSGCIGITLAKYLDVAFLTLSDISASALDVAWKNVERFSDRFHDNVLGFRMNALDQIKELPFKDMNYIFVANPPYIIKEKVDESVLDYEPHLALFTDESLSVYVDIMKKIKEFNTTCLIVFEMSDEIKDLLIKYKNEIFGDTPYTIINDINGKARTFGIFVKC